MGRCAFHCVQILSLKSYLLQHAILTALTTQKAQYLTVTSLLETIGMQRPPLSQSKEIGILGVCSTLKDRDVYPQVWTCQLLYLPKVTSGRQYLITRFHDFPSLVRLHHHPSYRIGTLRCIDLQSLPWVIQGLSRSKEPGQPPTTYPSTDPLA